MRSPIDPESLKNLLRAGVPVAPVAHTTHIREMREEVKTATLTCVFCGHVMRQTYWPNHLITNHNLTLQQWIDHMFVLHKDLQS